MDKYTLNIFEFETQNHNKYIFDNCKGVVIPSSKEMSFIIHNFEKPKEVIFKYLKDNFCLDKSEFLSVYNYVKDLINSGMLMLRSSEVISSKKITYDDILNTLSSQLILILTEACNMRCKYCIYSEHYPGLKSYSNKSMSLETALKAVDKYIDFHNEKAKKGVLIEPSITFYGGEPFLKFDIIESVIAYCEKKNFKAKFHVTTNGTIMTEKMIDFIIDKNIHVTFSLDGYKENHDRNRVLTNNIPTFELIFKNIKRLQEKRHQLAKKQLLIFSVTFDLETDAEKVIEFFEENDKLFSPYMVRYGKVGDYGTDYYDNQNLENNVLNASFKRLYSKFCKTLSENSKEKMSPALKAVYSNLWLLDYKQKFVVNDRKELCVPGCKLSVSPDENIYVCEKVNQECPIGTLDEGFCLEKINVLVNKYTSIINKKCINCNVSRLCDMCYAQMVCNGDLALSKTSCENTRLALQRSLISFYSLLEKNKKMQDITFETEDFV